MYAWTEKNGKTTRSPNSAEAAFPRKHGLTITVVRCWARVYLVCSRAEGRALRVTR